MGLSAIMAAKLQGCRLIIGIDRVESRLKLAQELGATHVVNSGSLPAGTTLVDAVKKLADDVGPDITIDTSGVSALIEAGVEFTRNFGKYIQVGSAQPDFELKVNVFTFMCTGKQIIGAIEGDSVPADYVPKMIGWYREGKFPFDKLVKFLKAEEFETALHEMHTGETVKPVLLWS